MTLVSQGTQAAKLSVVAAGEARVLLQIASGEVLHIATLGPGSRALVTGREAAFLERYGAGFLILGSYQDGNSNKLANDGERLVLNDASGTPITDFSWDHNAPWPSSADGLGFSLVLMVPGSNDPALPGSWRPSLR